MSDIAEVIWNDLQPGIQPACEKIVRSDAFQGLFSVLKSNPELTKVSGTMNVKNIQYGSGFYEITIGNAPTYYFVQIGSKDRKTYSIGEIRK